MGAAMKRFLLIINVIIVTIGNCGSPLILRVYFLHGGKRIWFTSWLLTSGWPIILIPLWVNYMRRRRSTVSRPKLILMDRRVFLVAMVLGVLIGLDNYLFAYGLAKLPVSTAFLIMATQLAFTAVFAFFIIRQRFTALSVNAVILLTLGAVVLGIHANSDRPAGESKHEYIKGFFMTLAAAALYGLILPVVELTYTKVKEAVSYTLVLEIQLVMSFFSTVFATMGMLVNHDFQAISREAMSYELGEVKYYLVIIWSAVIGQCFYLGAIGIIFYASSLLSAIVMTVAIPITQILAVFLFDEKFQAEKGIALFLSIWGFLSYFYGEHEKQKIRSNQVGNNNVSDDHIINETQLAQQIEGP